MQLYATSFDIGYQNFAYYTEVINLSELNKLQSEYASLKNVQKKAQHKIYIEKVCKLGKRKCMGVVALSDIVLTDVQNKIDLNLVGLNTKKTDERYMCKKGTYDENSRRRLLTYLDSNEGMWNKSELIVIEQQFFSAFTKRKDTQVNMNAVKIAEDLLMYFMIKFPQKFVCLFNSALKTSTFGCPKKLTKDQRKKFSCERAQEVFTLRSDTQAQYIYELSERVKRKRKVDHFIAEYEEKIVNTNILKLCEKIVKEKQKLDDVSDAFNQLQAFKFKRLLCE